MCTTHRNKKQGSFSPPVHIPTALPKFLHWDTVDRRKRPFTAIVSVADFGIARKVISYREGGERSSENVRVRVHVRACLCVLFDLVALLHALHTQSCEKHKGP